MYILVSILLVFSIVNMIAFTPKDMNKLNRGMESEDDSKKVVSLMFGCLYIIYMLPYTIIYLITVINLAKIDPYLYPSIGILAIIAFNMIKNALRNKDKPRSDKRTAYSIIYKLLQIAYLVYILIIL